LILIGIRVFFHKNKKKQKININKQIKEYLFILSKNKKHSVINSIVIFVDVIIIAAYTVFCCLIGNLFVLVIVVMK